MAFGFTNTAIDVDDYQVESNGTGIGFDIGFTYAIQDYSDSYRLKFGLALLDIGRIHFNKNTEDHLINKSTTFGFNPRNLEDVTDFRDGLEQLNNELFDDTTRTLVGNNYAIWLPGAISLQADYVINEKCFCECDFDSKTGYQSTGSRKR